MTITEKYIAKILPYLDDDIKIELVNGLQTYNFDCPWCSMYSNKEKSKRKKSAYLSPVQDSFEYRFVCMRSYSPECRRIHGGRSFYNFLAMYNPHLFEQYKKELETLRA